MELTIELMLVVTVIICLFALHPALGIIALALIGITFFHHE